jgi:hypothetical protein
VVDWRVVAVAGVPLWAMVGGLVAWQKWPPQAAAVGPVVSAVSPVFTPPPVVEFLPPPRVEEPVNPFKVVTTQPAEAKPVAIDPEVAELVADGLRKAFWELMAGKPEDGRVAGVPPEKRDVPAGCKTHGTALHFVKSYDEAKQRAAKERKLVFVLHLSGNIEDDGFT